MSNYPPDDETEEWIAPDTNGLPCDAVISHSGDEYMRRFYLPSSPNKTTARYHHILASDPDKDFHDHPWDFVSTLLHGVYIEHTPRGSIVYKAPCVIHRKAAQLHRLELPEGPVWSYVLLGPVKRKWGYMTKRGWVPWDKYNGGSIAGCGPENPRRPFNTPKRRTRKLAKW